MPFKVFLLSHHRNWILEAFAKESAEAIGQRVSFNYVPYRKLQYLNPLYLLHLFYRLKHSKNALFVHHQVLNRLNIPSRNGNITNTRLLLTHVDDSTLFDKSLLNKITKMQLVLVQNHAMKSFLISKGLLPERIRVVHGAIDRRVYCPSQTPPGRTFVLIVGDCKPRKNPLLVSDVILKNPDIQFMIHGKGWESQLTTKALHSKNLTLLPFNLEKNPAIMREASLLLSLSKNEGGPIPILEALASGTPVLATDTGFCKEVIPEDSGQIIPIEASVEEISRQIHRLITRKKSVWNRDLLNGKYTWAELGSKLYG
jgi:glycosyltransferase involved in cell wall biosynthesis